MGVYTTADVKLESAKDHLQKAINDMVELINPDTWGHSEYSSDAMDRFIEASLELIKIRRKL